MKIVLHICCGICALPALLKLTREGHEVTGFFYNPNIYPLEEFEKRLTVAQIVCREFKVPLEAAPYEPDIWLQITSSLKNEPEGGTRCPICFRMRLEKTFHFLLANGADKFTTTLTSSRHKPAPVINRIGQEIGGDKFLICDFKKTPFTEKTKQLVQQWNLYRQKYCGCLYSQPKHK